MADRFGGRKTLLWTELVSAAIAGSLAALEFTGRLHEGLLVAGAIVIGLAFTFALPARNITVRRFVAEQETELVAEQETELVAEQETKAAYAMDSVSYNLGRALAPPLGVGLIAAFGFGYAFAANAASFLIFTVVLVVAGKGSSEPVMRSRVWDGFLTAWHEGRIMILLLMVVAVTIASDPILVLGPALASHVFGKAASWSWMFIAALGAGSVLGSMRRSKRTPSLKLAAVVLGALGLFMMVFVLSTQFYVSVVFAGLAGATCLVANSATRTLLATEAGPAREARVMAVWAIAWAGSKPLASLMDGLLPGVVGRIVPDPINIKVTGVLLALPAITPIIVLVLWPELGRKLASRRDITAQADQRHASEPMREHAVA
jgi:MFS family permease